MPSRTDPALPAKEPEKKPDPKPTPTPVVIKKPVTVVVKKPANPTKPVVTTLVVIPPAIDPVPTSVMYSLPAYAVTYTSADFDNYDWSSDRRFAPSIFGPIDANIEKMRTEIVAK
ncbi:MAG: hypothetical protein ACOYN2_06400 [Patescibacteria group bacterium]